MGPVPEMVSSSVVVFSSQVKLSPQVPEYVAAEAAWIMAHTMTSASKRLTILFIIFNSSLSKDFPVLVPRQEEGRPSSICIIISIETGKCNCQYR